MIGTLGEGRSPLDLGSSRCSGGANTHRSFWYKPTPSNHASDISALPSQLSYFRHASPVAPDVKITRTGKARIGRIRDCYDGGIRCIWREAWR